MFTSLCLLSIGALACLLVARRYKSAKVYTGLLSVLLLGFVVGAGVKYAVANASNTPIQMSVVTTASPTVQGSTTAVVETVENFKFTEPSKDLEGDTVVTNDMRTTTQPLICEIEDDS